MSQFTSSPKHSLLLHGKPGSGKKTLAKTIAGTLLNIKPSELQKHPYTTTIDPDETTISIESIRSLQQFLRLKVPGVDTGTINRIVLIYDAERMRHEAQNALLKTLEEPPTGTCIILTAATPKKLLSTITSRTHLLEVLPIDLQTAQTAYPDTDPATLRKLHALSQGQAKLLQTLLDQSEHPLLDHIDTAKLVLAQKKGERLLQVDELAKDKAAARQLLEAFLRISHAGLFAAATKNSPAQIEQWCQRQDSILQSLRRLEQNAHTKLVLDDLFLSI